MQLRLYATCDILQFKKCSFRFRWVIDEGCGIPLWCCDIPCGHFVQRSRVLRSEVMLPVTTVVYHIRLNKLISITNAQTVCRRAIRANRVRALVSELNTNRRRTFSKRKIDKNQSLRSMICQTGEQSRSNNHDSVNYLRVIFPHVCHQSSCSWFRTT